jgi:diguanylate cyclase (GGDEF)-like protein/PAS domain S-box-containing protein
MYKNLQVNTLVNIVIGLIITLIVILMVGGYVQLSNIDNFAKRITDLRVPTVKASATMNTNINSSLAALRGWMLIGEKHFISDRRLAWQLIRQQESDMWDYSKNWTNPDNSTRLSTISLLLDKLENEQEVIEHIAHTEDNIPSTKILLNDAAPLAAQIINNITKLIDFSKTQPVSDSRLAVLATMADLRGSFALSLAEIRAFLISANPKFRNSYEVLWERNENSYAHLIELSGSLTLFESGVLSEIDRLREAFRPLPKKMFDSRMADDWNKANYLLKTSAVKISQDINSLLVQMVANQNALLESDSKFLSDRTIQLQIFMVIFLIILLIISLYASSIINQRFSSFKSYLKARDTLIDQNVMMATLDKDGIILDISNSLCRNLKSVKKDLIGTQSNFFHTSNADIEENEVIHKLLETGEAWRGEFLRTDRDEEGIWFSSHIIPVRDDSSGTGTGTGTGTGGTYSIILEDISDRKLFEEISITDKLTSLFNRRKFDDVMDMEIKLARRRRTHLSLAIIDIDYFKNYNDHYGHPTGDSALVRVASALKSCFNRPDDYVFRLGGEEFGVVFNSLDKKQSLDILERSRKIIESLKIEHADSKVSEFLTISTGVKVCSDDDMHQKDVFYSEADGALYDAKKTRNSVSIG